MMSHGYYSSNGRPMAQGCYAFIVIAMFLTRTGARILKEVQPYQSLSSECRLVKISSLREYVLDKSSDRHSGLNFIVSFVLSLQASLCSISILATVCMRLNNTDAIILFLT